MNVSSAYRPQQDIELDRDVESGTRNSNIKPGTLTELSGLEKDVLESSTLQYNGITRKFACLDSGWGSKVFLRKWKLPSSILHR